MPTVRDRSGTTPGLDLGQHFPIPGFNDSQDAPGPGVKGSLQVSESGSFGVSNKGPPLSGLLDEPQGFGEELG